MPNEGERLAAMEAIMQRMERKLDLITDNYPTRLEVQEMLRSRDEKIADQQAEIDRLRDEKDSRSHNWPMWISVGIAALMALYTIWPKK